MTKTKENPWRLLEEEWPTDHEKKYTFWNENLQDYRIDTVEGIENNFKRFHQHFSYLQEQEAENEMIQHYLKYCHRWTHWQEVPEPPKKSD